MIGIAAGEVGPAAPARVAEFGSEFHAAVFIAGAGGDDGADIDVRGPVEKGAAVGLAGFGLLPGAAQRPACAEERAPAAGGAEIVFADDGEFQGFALGVGDIGAFREGGMVAWQEVVQLQPLVKRSNTNEDRGWKWMLEVDSL